MSRQSLPVVTIRHRTPPWGDHLVRAFMNDMKYGVRSGALVQTTSDLMANHHELLMNSLAENAQVVARWGATHYTLGPREPIAATTYMAWGDVAVFEVAEHIRAHWLKCALLGPDLDDDFVYRWRSSGPGLSVVDRKLTTRLSIGVTVHFVRPVCGASALSRGAGYALVSAAWTLVANNWQCKTRLGIALLNTSFSRLLLLTDDGGSDILVVEATGVTEHEREVSELANVQRLAHDFLPNGDIDRDAFTLYWATIVRGYDIAGQWGIESRHAEERLRAEMDELAGREDERGGEEEEDDDDGSDTASSDEADGDETDVDETDEDAEDEDTSSESSRLSAYRFNFNDPRYDDVPHLITSLACVFPRCRIVSPDHMTELIDREVPTFPTGDAQDGE